MIKIKNIQSFVFRYPINNPVITSFGIMKDRPMLLVKVTDKDGAFGWGEVWCNFPSVGAEYRSKLIASIFILAMAYYIELIGKHTPCNLCTLERIPYFIVAFIASYYFIATKSFKKAKALVFAIAAAFTSGFLLSVYHVGIENYIFPEFSGCSANNLDITDKESLLNSLNNFIPNCKDVTYRILGLSLATINVLISGLILIISLLIMKK